MKGDSIVNDPELVSLAAEANRLEQPDQSAPESPAPAVPDNIETAALLFPLINGLFLIITPAWGVTPVESKMLADAWAPVIDKYLPNGFGVEGAAILATVAIIGPRVKMQRKKSTEKNPASQVAPADLFPTAKNGDPDGSVH